MAVLDNKTDWFWSEDALDYWREIEKRLRVLMQKHGQEIIDRGDRTTITKEDIQGYIQTIYKELAEHEQKHLKDIRR